MVSAEEEALDIHVGVGFYGTSAYDPQTFKISAKVIEELMEKPAGSYQLVTYVNVKTGKPEYYITQGEKPADIRRKTGTVAYVSNVAVDPSANRIELEGTVYSVAARRSMGMTDQYRISAAYDLGRLKCESENFRNYAVFVTDRVYRDLLKGNEVEYVIGTVANDPGKIFISPVVEKDRSGVPLKVLDENGKKLDFNINSSMIPGNIYIVTYNRNEMKFNSKKISGLSRELKLY